MNIKTIAVIALAAILAACLVPIAETDAVYSNVDGDPVIGTGDDAEYTITYTNHDYDSYQDLSMAISYDAKLVDSSGETISNGVSPSSGDLDNGGSATLTVVEEDMVPLILKYVERLDNVNKENGIRAFVWDITQTY